MATECVRYTGFKNQIKRLTINERRVSSTCNSPPGARRPFGTWLQDSPDRRGNSSADRAIFHVVLRVEGVAVFNAASGETIRLGI